MRPTLGVIGVVLSSPYCSPFDLLGEFIELSDLMTSGVELTARLYSIWKDRFGRVLVVELVDLVDTRLGQRRRHSFYIDVSLDFDSSRAK